MVFEGKLPSGEGFLEGKIAVVSFTCSGCHHVRKISAKKISPISVLVADKKNVPFAIPNRYEVEINPLPNSQQAFAAKMLEAHVKMFHGDKVEIGISDARN